MSDPVAASGLNLKPSSFNKTGMSSTDPNVSFNYENGI